ncbi:PilN domain-containing protein [Desulfosediminicola flagellatus]|uniref:PilN domain-containing protein n=1 Tax=Desulfosediminicola flagellatus TaxID=2569541 RepID=UPI0010AD9BEF|nr:PilN domain-containing protein [Desulfosediminicola flagellatus]
MIKINLLPVRQLKKRAKARNQLIGLFVGLLCLFSVAGLVTYYQLGKVTVLENQISALNKEKQRYAPIIAQIKKMEQQKKELERRIDVIKKLKTDSSLTVRVMDEVANIIDTDRMWLLSLNQQGGSLQLSGIALDNQTVAQFMDNLKVSPIVRDVDLTDSSLKNIAGRDLKSFSMTVSVAQPEPKQVATAK